MDRIGLFGGTFDPIHNGHIRTADFVLSEFNLTKVIFIPANIPPNKSDKKIADGNHRIEMINLAIQDYGDKFSSSRIELDRSGNSYTIETIESFQKSDSESEFYLMMGSDNFQQFTTWKNWQEILLRVQIIVFNKFSDEIIFPEPLKPFSDRILFSQSPLINISSTDVRNRIYSNKNVNLPIHFSVENYIRSNNLYR